MRHSFTSTLFELCEENPHQLLLTGDLGFGVFEPFIKRFPSQFLNMGVAEQNMIGVASGLALMGHTVFTYSIGNFSTLRCLEQIRNNVCYHDLSVTMVAIGAGFSYGALGFSHHLTEDISILRALPYLKICSPGTVKESAECTRYLAKLGGPGYLRLDKSSPEDTVDTPFEFGKPRLVREGGDITLITTGSSLQDALIAAKELDKDGIQCGILHCPVLSPLDGELICQKAKETQRVMTIEEHTLSGGFGSLIAEILTDNNALPELFIRVGLPKTLSSIVGSQAYLKRQFEIDAQGIVAKVKLCLNR